MPSVVRRVLWGLLAVLAVAVVWTVLVLLSVRSDLESAREQLVTAADAEDVTAARLRIAGARERLERADRRLAHPGPVLIGALPVVGRTVDAIADTTGATLAVVVSGQQLLAALPDPLMTEGRIDVAALREVARVAQGAADRTRGPVAQVEDVELGLVPDLVADGVLSARDRLRGAPAAFARTASAVSGLTGVLGADEPRSMLVMLQNNAELRGTGGVVTVFAQATARDGRLDIGAFRDVKDVADVSDEVTRVDAPDDYEALWGPFLANSTLWLNVNMTPDVPTASSVLADVAVASGLPRPDAVVWLDVPAIAALLGATGPVELPDGTGLTRENAVRTLLSDTYADAVDTAEGQAERRAALRAAADAVLGRLLSADGPQAPLSRLAGALADATAGGHVALWSDDPDEQRALVDGGLAGEVAAEGDDLSSVALQNFGGGNRQGNKLDYYARRQVTVRVVVGEDEAVVEQEIAVRNTAPPRGLPEYVAGEVSPGTSRNYLAVAVPAGATGVELGRAGSRLSAAVQPSGDHTVVTDGLEISPGATATWRLRYRLPVDQGRYRLRLFPQPLAVDSGLYVEIRAADGRELRGTGVEDGRLVISGPFTSRQVLEVEAVRPGLLERAVDGVRRFWNEPVRLP